MYGHYARRFTTNVLNEHQAGVPSNISQKYYLMVQAHEVTKGYHQSKDWSMDLLFSAKFGVSPSERWLSRDALHMLQIKARALTLELCDKEGSRRSQHNSYTDDSFKVNSP